MKDQFEIFYKNNTYTVNRERMVYEDAFDSMALDDECVTYDIALGDEFVAVIHTENKGFIDCEGSELMSFEEGFELSKVIDSLLTAPAPAPEAEYISELIEALDDNDSEEFEAVVNDDILELYYDDELIATKDIDTDSVEVMIDVKPSLIRHKFDVIEYSMCS
ncbi:hypothetical protein AB6D11_06550 [Vibrio splendidus]